jgi:MFS family permease
VSGTADRIDARTRSTLRRAVLVLILTQMIGWGSIFHVPAVLYAHISAGTGISQQYVFGGLTLMLLIAAALAAPIGRALERDGSRKWMAAGSIVTAVGLCALAAADGPFLFLVAWVLFGAAMPIALTQAASTAIVQISPARARQAIAILLLVTGFSSTLNWPSLIWLADAFTWRGAVLAYAAMNLVVCLPLHLWSIPGREVLVRDVANEAFSSEVIAPPPPAVRGAYSLAAITFALGGMLTWGLPLHMVGILTGFGHAEKSAVAIGGLFGPGQVLARGFEMVGGKRVDILTMGIVAAVLMLIALGSLLAWGELVAGAVVFSVSYGLSAGLISIVRAIAPLRLFGAASYARVLGRLNVPQNIAFALTPFGFAVISESWGARALVEVSLGLALLCLVSTALLHRRVMAAEARARSLSEAR